MEGKEDVVLHAFELLFAEEVSEGEEVYYESQQEEDLQDGSEGEHGLCALIVIVIG